MDTKSIKTEIKTILDSLTGTASSKLFSVAYDYPETQFTSYPAARVYVLGGGAQGILDFNSVWQSISFVVDVFFQYVDGKSEYDVVLDNLKSLMVELNRQSNYTLNGQAEYVLADTFEMFYPDEMEAEKYMGYSILIEVRKVQSTTP